jgi:hypothetical protein
MVSGGLKLPLFPVRAGASAPPLVQDWQHQATTDPQRIALWRDLYPGCNEAISCWDLVVIDVDVKHGKDGAATLRALVEAGYPFPDTRTVTTPSGGWHLYYLRPPGSTIRNGVNVLGPGVDVRTRGGYVVAPGSSTPLGRYVLSVDMAPQPLPPWLRERLEQRRAEPRINGEVAHGVDPDAAVLRAREWLANAAPAVQGEGGDHRTFAVCCKIRDLGVPQDRALETLEDWNSTCNPPWDLADLERKIINAWKYGQNPPAVDAPEAHFGVVDDGLLLHPGAITREEVLRLKYVVKDWIDEDQVGMLFGPPGSGKTFNALALAMRVATGERWYGQRVRGGAVLYLGYEGGAGLKFRLMGLRDAHPEVDWERIALRYQCMDRPVVGPLGKDGQARVAAMLAQLKEQTRQPLRLLIIDPLRDALGGSDSDPELTAPFIAYLRHLRTTYGCAVCVVHHPGHGDTHRARGDSAIDGAMDFVIHVDPVTSSMNATKQRDAQTGRVFYHLERVSLGIDADGDERATCVAVPLVGDTDPKLNPLQREFLARLHDADEGDGVSKTLARALALNPKDADGLLLALQRKGYVTFEGAKVHTGAGAGEIFS